MKKIVKRLLSLVLVGATILSMGMVAAAAPVEEPANVIDVEGIERGADAVAVSSFFVYYGENKAVLLNTPTENEYLDKGIYEE